MDIMELGAIGELIGGVAVIASLVFVGLQVRGSRLQDRLSMLTALDKSWNEINAQIAQDGELGSVFARGIAAPEALSDDEATRFFFLACQYINIHKSVWTLLQDNQLASHHERWFRFDIRAIYGTPGFWKVFLSIEGTMQDDFVAFIRRQRVVQTEFFDWRSARDDGAVPEATGA